MRSRMGHPSNLRLLDGRQLASNVQNYKSAELPQPTLEHLDKRSQVECVPALLSCKAAIHRALAIKPCHTSQTSKHQAANPPFRPMDCQRTLCA